ncbi:MAG: serine/threonine protein kinase, partial [Deltaproteobacteria bacterium]|nr:serine/threonine protein kinase [Deltaproteobacteria bacterium]
MGQDSPSGGGTAVREVAAPEPAPPVRLPLPGEVLAGKYEIEGVLGEGGMGVVLAARHRQLGQRVALKFLQHELVGVEQAAERFLREARAVAAIRGEHVARVLDVGEIDGGVPYIVMEHLTGTDLETIVEHDGPLGVQDAVHYLLQAGEAVAEAHALGLVHRDLKPSNLFVTQGPDGAPLVKVLDFGIAKALDQTSGAGGKVTATGMSLGSPGYMAPEQVLDPRSVDARADIWALGAVLYELLAARPAFEAETVPAVYAKIVCEDPRPLCELRPELPAELGRIVARCLTKDRACRFGSVAELARALVPFAPEHARALAQRIERIGGVPLPAPANWAEPDGVAQTVLSERRSDAPAASREPRTLERPGRPGPAGGGVPAGPQVTKPSAADEPARSEIARLAGGRRRGGLAAIAAAGALALCGLALWIFAGSGRRAASALPAIETVSAPAPAAAGAGAG